MDRHATASAVSRDDKRKWIATPLTRLAMTEWGCHCEQGNLLSVIASEQGERGNPFYSLA